MQRLRVTSAVAFLALLLASSEAGAEPNELATEPRARRSAEILVDLDHPRPDSGWLDAHMQRFHVRHKRGVAYTQPLDLGERGAELSVIGPGVSGKSVGLAVEFRF